MQDQVGPLSMSQAAEKQQVATSSDGGIKVRGPGDAVPKAANLHPVGQQNDLRRRGRQELHIGIAYCAADGNQAGRVRKGHDVGCANPGPAEPRPSPHHVSIMTRDHQRAPEAVPQQRREVARGIDIVGVDDIESPLPIQSPQPPAVPRDKPPRGDETGMTEHRVWQRLIAQVPDAAGPRGQHRDVVAGMHKTPGEGIDHGFLAADKRKGRARVQTDAHRAFPPHTWPSRRPSVIPSRVGSIRFRECSHVGRGGHPARRSAVPDGRQLHPCVQVDGHARPIEWAVLNPRHAVRRSRRPLNSTFGSGTVGCTPRPLP